MSPKEDKRGGHLSNSVLMAVMAVSILMIFGVFTLHPGMSEDSYAVSGEHSVDGLSYRITSTTEVALIQGSDIMGAVIIPDTVTIEGSTYKVTTIATNAFANSVGIESVTIGANVNKIENGAFSSCLWMTGLVIPDNVTSIGDFAFESCTNLVNVTLSNALRAISKDVFMNCTSLASISIPESVREIGVGAFNGCSALRTVTFVGDSNLATIGYNAFGACKSLEGITLPGTLVGDSAFGNNIFYGCDSLKTVVLSNGITLIPNNFLNRLKALESVSIPDSVTKIGNFSFANCPALKNVTFGDTPSLKSIGKSAFINCTSLVEIALPGSLDSYRAISEDIFMGCTALRTVTFSEGIVAIPKALFRDLTTLTTVVLPRTLEVIGDHAFNGCTSLVTIVIPADVVLSYVGAYSFRGCSALEEITLPGSLSSDSAIGPYAFYECKSLNTVTLSEGITVVPSYIFSGLSELEIVHLPSTLFRIEDHAFASCTKLVVAGGDVINLSYIGDYAFNGCLTVEEVNFPDGLTYLGEGVFYQCSNLKLLQLNSGLHEIGDLAFAGTALETVSIPASVISFGQGVFSSCKNLREINVESGNNCVKVVDGVLYSIDGKTLLQVPGAYPDTTTGDAVFEFIVPNTVETIGMRAFACCTFESIKIPDSVTVVENGAFMSCPYLSTVTWSNKATEMKSTTFKDCSELRTVFINGSEKIVIASYAFQGASNVRFVSGSTDPNVKMKMYSDEGKTKSLSLEKDMSTYKGTVYFKWVSGDDPDGPDVPDDDRDSGSGNVVVYVGIVVGLIAVLGAAMFYFMRKK